MPEEITTLLKFISFFVVGFFVNYGVTWLAAPDYSGTALAVGAFLTSFGIVLAISAMQFVMLPVGLFKLIGQLIRGEKPIKANPRADKLDHIGRCLFVLLYTMLCVITGAYVGALSGGMGLFAAVAMFAATGIGLSLSAPMVLVWGSSADAGATGMDKSQKADLEQARRNGDPAVIFADKVSKRIIDALVEQSSGGDKPDQR